MPLKFVLKSVRTLPKQAWLFIVTIIALIGLWMFIDPMKQWLVGEFGITPVWSIILGLVIIYIAYAVWNKRVI